MSDEVPRRARRRDETRRTMVEVLQVRRLKRELGRLPSVQTSRERPVVGEEVGRKQPVRATSSAREAEPKLEWEASASGVETYTPALVPLERGKSEKSPEGVSYE
jgi:hypothetical protein